MAGSLWLLEELFPDSQAGQQTTLVPVGKDLALVLIGREEVDQPPRDHVAQVAENASCLHHHCRQLSLLEGELQLLAGGPTAEDQGQDVVWWDNVTTAKLYNVL